jgi:hypothetical protein
LYALAAVVLLIRLTTKVGQANAKTMNILAMKKRKKNV